MVLHHQKAKKESLQCPAKYKRKDVGAGYETFVQDDSLALLKKLVVLS